MERHVAENCSSRRTGLAYLATPANARGDHFRRNTATDSGHAGDDAGRSRRWSRGTAGGLGAATRGDWRSRRAVEQLASTGAREKERKAVPFHVIINPEITLLGDARADFYEGCLSLPGFSAVVTRARRVRVAYLDERGEPQSVEASGWYARILQHEIDLTRDPLHRPHGEPYVHFARQLESFLER